MSLVPPPPGGWAVLDKSLLALPQLTYVYTHHTHTRPGIMGSREIMDSEPHPRHLPVLGTQTDSWTPPCTLPQLPTPAKHPDVSVSPGAGHWIRSKAVGAQRAGKAAPVPSPPPPHLPETSPGASKAEQGAPGALLSQS